MGITAKRISNKGKRINILTPDNSSADIFSPTFNNICTIIESNVQPKKTTAQPKIVQGYTLKSKIKYTTTVKNIVMMPKLIIFELFSEDITDPK